MKEITSPTHALVKYWTALRQDAKLKKAESRVLLEGKNCIYDVAKKITPKRLIVSDKKHLAPALQADEVILIPDALMKKIAATESPEGIVAEFEMPKNPLKTNPRRILVADRIQDPGNLGTLIRSSLAFGWDGLFILPGTVDPFNDKALRAAKGATFFLPLAYGSWQDLDALCKNNALKLIVADVAGEAPETFRHQKMALVLGNEAQGALVPNELAHSQVTITMQPEMESLNVAVAGSILLYLYQEAL